MTETVATAVVAALQELGVRYVFGVPSGGWVDYMEALRVADGIEFILTTHEGGASMMAAVAGGLTGVPGVCFGTFGPGATNLTTGVGAAQLDRQPMIALTDEMPAAMRGRVTQMGIDHQALFAPLTKHTTRLSADAVRATLFDAARTALEGRPGAVHVGLPVGLSAQPAGAETIGFSAPAAPPPAAPDLLQQAKALLAGARKPLLAIGLGAVHARLAAPITALAERHDIPVVLTPMAKGMLPEDHPSYAGVLFHALSDVVGETHAQADLVIAIGYDPIEFNYEAWLSPGARLVSLDVAPADIDSDAYSLAVDAVGDIAGSLASLLTVPPVAHEWDMAAMRRRRDDMFARLAPGNAGFGPKAALAILRDVLPPAGIMACDVGAHTHLIGQAWPTPAPGRQIMTNGWSTMGYGLPAAIAAKLVCPDQPVCAVVGDGGFLMTAGELATAVRYNLKIVVVLFTDNDLALIRIKQQKKSNPIYGTAVRDAKTLGGSVVFGVPLHTVQDPIAFRTCLEDAFAADGPVIVEALLDSREYDDVVLRKDKT